MRVCLTLMLMGLSMVMTGCGKKGKLYPPPGVESEYPREYPSPEGYIQDAGRGGQ